MKEATGKDEKVTAQWKEIEKLKKWLLVNRVKITKEPMGREGSEGVKSSTFQDE